jgi:peptide/nickel transport system ATP-binding protein
LPDPTDPPEGCRFAPRCPHAVADCRTGDQPPFFAATTVDHEVSCVHFGPGGDPTVVTDDDTLPGDGDDGETGDADGTRRVENGTDRGGRR